MKKWGMSVGVVILIVIFGQLWSSARAQESTSTGYSIIPVTTGGTQVGVLVGNDTSGGFTVVGIGSSNTSGYGGTTGTQNTGGATGASGLGATYGSTGGQPNLGGFYQWPPGTNNYYPIQVGVKGGGAGGDRKYSVRRVTLSSQRRVSVIISEMLRYVQHDKIIL